MLMKSLTHNIIESKANAQALKSFLQSILNSGIDVSITTLSPDLAAITQCHSAVSIGELLIPIKRFSLTGEHDYLEYFLKGHKRVYGHDWINELIEQLRLIGVDADFEVFSKRIRESTEVITQALYKRRFELHSVYAASTITFQEAEQLVVFGHPSHPYPKLREGFSKSDLETFSPEFAGEFNLQWLAIKPELLIIEFAHDNAINDLALLEAVRPVSGYQLVPMHPWQWSILKKRTWITKALENEEIKELTAAQDKKWTATTSVRTVYAKHSPVMLKYSLDVRITNSIRHLQTKEVVRGLQFIDVLNTRKGQEFQQRFPSFHMLLEPGYLALINPKGEIETDSIVTWRENPFQSENEQECITLSALTQSSPFDEGNLLLRRLPANKEDLCDWFAGFLDIVLKPFIVAAGDYGIYFGAHQQNIVIKLNDKGFPHEVYFRDCQGTGYESEAYKAFNLDIKSNGNDLPSSIANKLIGYYLIVNSSFGVISALARSNIVFEKELIVILRKFLNQLIHVKDKSFIEYLLESDYIYKKNNFMCSLENHNENTIENPFNLYTKIKNPIYAVK